VTPEAVAPDAAASHGVTGVIPSPNIWQHAATYELENRGVDPDRRIEAAMLRLRSWSSARVLDIGCGNGFHLPRFVAGGAATVTGVEPHPPLVDAARARLAALDLLGVAEVHQASAAGLPLPDASVDVAHARWAYFFGPGCEPGLAELDRVMAPGGIAFVIDTDASTSTFGGWFRRSLPTWDPVALERFWTRQGWEREPLDVRLELPDRASFEAVVRIEFAPALADAILAEHPGHGVDHAVNVYHRRF
jgi:SAM-dependent methyltransferase